MTRRAVWLWLVVQVALAAWFLAGSDVALRGLPLDDAWIHLVYGRALLTEGGPSYNPGQLEAGFTSPLQMLIAALAEGIGSTGLPAPVALKLLGVAVALPQPLLAARIASRRGGDVAGLVAAGLVALSPTLAFAQVSGMEVSLAATTLLGTWDAAERRRHAGVWLAAAVLARPEAVILVPWVASRSGLRSLLLPAAVLVAWGGFDLHVTGHLLPATYYAKATSWAWQRVPVFGAALLGSWAWLAWGIGLVPWAAGVVADARRSRAEAIVHAIPVAFVLAVGGGRAVSDSPDYFYFLRYFLPVEPMFHVTAAVGMVALSRWRVAWLLLVPTMLFTVAALPERRARYGWNCRDIELLNGEVARWLASTPPADAPVATCDAGYVRYAGGHPTRDLMGLNDHALLFDTTRRAALYTDPSALAAWMDEAGVRWVVAFPGVFPFTEAERDPGRWFRVAYAVHAPDYTVLTAKQDTLVVYERRLP